MYYYKFHIGDYRAATSHLSNDEDLAYRRLLDMYYDTEKPIPNDTEWVSRRLRLDTDLVLSVLKDFFILQDDGWFHGRCHDVINQYHCMAEKNRENGKLGGRPKKTQSVSNGNPMETQIKPKITLTNNQEPITNNYKPITKIERATRLPDDWQPSDDMIQFCLQERPDLDWKFVSDGFRDYWISQAGAKGRKADWSATWRNWVRNQRKAFGHIKTIGGKTQNQINADLVLADLLEEENAK
jgi:uncharacterized protein YdaU (DUF1376 family)